MERARITCIIFLFLAFSAGAAGQKNLEIPVARGLMQPAEKTRYKITLDNRNELEALSQVFFTGYKQFFSSQDLNVCVFHPSCSEFAIQSVRQKGFVAGMLAAFDRLSRCHSLAPEQYPVHQPSGLFHDPVRVTKMSHGHSH